MSGTPGSQGGGGQGGYNPFLRGYGNGAGGRHGKNGHGFGGGQGIVFMLEL